MRGGKRRSWAVLLGGLAIAAGVTVADYRGRIKLGEHRGVPSARLGTQLELYTADSTVVIFANPKQGKRAAAALQPLADDGAPADFPPPIEQVPELAPPVPGALSGELSCKAAEASSAP